MPVSKQEALFLLEEYRRIPALIREAKIEQEFGSEIKSPIYSTMSKANGIVSDPISKLAIKRAEDSKRIEYLQKKEAAMTLAAAHCIPSVYWVFWRMYEEGLSMDTLVHESGLPRKRIEALHKELIEDVARYYSLH